MVRTGHGIGPSHPAQPPPARQELASRLCVVATAAAAWAALLALARAGGAAHGMAGMGMPSAHGNPWSQAATAMPSWLLMTIAMMAPAALPRFPDVARVASPVPRAAARAAAAGVPDASVPAPVVSRGTVPQGGVPVTVAGARRTRRCTAMAGFGAGYLAVWAAFGFLAQAAAAEVPGVPGAAALAITLTVAAAWQLSPFKQRILRACHAAARAACRPMTVRAAARHGLRYGLCCLGTCWLLMLVMLTAPGAPLLWMAGLTVAITAERFVRDHRGVTRICAAALAVTAAATLSVAGLLR